MNKSDLIFWKTIGLVTLMVACPTAVAFGVIAVVAVFR